MVCQFGTLLVCADHNADLLTVTGHRFSAHQLLGHVVHLYTLYESLQGTGALSRLITVQRLGPAVRGMVCTYGMFHYGVRRWLHRVSTGQLGYSNFLVFLHYDWRLSAAVHFLEVL